MYMSAGRLLRHLHPSARTRRRAAGLLTALALALSTVVFSAAGAVAADDLIVQGPAFAVNVAPAGGIDSVVFSDGRVWSLGGRSLLTEGSNASAADQCTPNGGATATDDGGARWQTNCTDPAGHVTNVTEWLTPTSSSISWTLEVRSTEGSYSKGIWTKLSGWSDTHNRQFWTTWGQSPYAQGGQPAWSDPLRPAPFANLDLPYGGNAITGQNGFSVPIATIVEPDTDHGLSLVQSPDDILLNARIHTSAGGDVLLGRFDTRITPDKPVTFHMNLVPSAADWRPGLGWMVNHYADYFNPVSKNTDQLAGLGSYSSFTGPFTGEQVSELTAMDFRTNWDATFSWPYMGEFMPPVSSPDETWLPFAPQVHPGAPTTMSVNQLEHILQNWTDVGFHQLSYFNTTEFGTGISYPRPPENVSCNDSKLWTSPNDYLYCDYADAILMGTDNKPIFSWEGAVVMDPGAASYQQHLLDQARLLLGKEPEYAGINIDRTDWLLQYNTHADDGVSWYEGKPARSLISSWKELMPKLEALVHGMGKQVWVSPTAAKRVDWMKGVDGFFSEFNNGDMAMNLDAFMGLHKPVLGWNYDLGENSDQFIQRFLYMGVYPMGPVPNNDHGIGQSAAVSQAYADYGLMFRALEGKRWLLAPHAVQVTQGHALANVFTVPDGVVVPVVEGGSEKSAEITLHGLQQAVPGLDLARPMYLAPGSSTWQPLAITRVGNDGVQAEVPLTRGGALVRFLTAAAETTLPPSVSLASSGQWVAPATTVTVTATVRNDALTAIQDVSATLEVPRGWTATPLDQPVSNLTSGQTATFRWLVAAPQEADTSVETLTGRISYRHGEKTGQMSAKVRVAAGPPPSVTSRHIDDSTQGNWKGTYGSEGYVIANDGRSLPGSTQVDMTGPNTYTWNGTTDDVRALQQADSAGRIASCWYGTDWSFTVNATDGMAHQLAVYLLDWDYRTNQGPREETLTITDAFGNVLDEVDPGTFGNGKYVSWNVRGQVTVTVHMIFGGNAVGGNAVASGVFIDPATGT